MQLTLTEREAELLQGLLHDTLRSLELETARTERHEMRHLLLERQDLIERLLSQLSAKPA
jgi:hypothetical protein